MWLCQDHVATGVIFTVEDSVSLRAGRVKSLPSQLRYSLLGSGPLTTFGGVEGIAFVNTRYANASDDWPDVQFQFVSGSYASDGGDHLRHTVGFRQEYWTDYYSHLVHRDHFTVQVKLARPRSRGYVRLRSTNPYDHPEVRPADCVHKHPYWLYRSLLGLRPENRMEGLLREPTEAIE